jgi:hypothetical protein
MSDGPDNSETAERRAAPKHGACDRCGGINLPMTVLDTRNGKNFRLIRCVSCETISWLEER